MVAQAHWRADSGNWHKTHVNSIEFECVVCSELIVGASLSISLLSCVCVRSVSQPRCLHNLIMLICDVDFDLVETYATTNSSRQWAKTGKRKEKKEKEKQKQLHKIAHRDAEKRERAEKTA